MEVLYQRCAGIDVSKTDAKVCVRWGPGAQDHEVRTYGATRAEILRMRGDLEAAGAQMVGMESTGDYWKPVHYVLEETLPMMLINARDSKHVPGRKTDVSDAVWIAELVAHGLVNGSFVPLEPIRQLRDLTRARAHLVQEKVREYSRIEKILEDAGIKLSAKVSSLRTRTARDMLAALAAGQSDPQVLAGLARAGNKTTRAEFVDALTGSFTSHHAYMVGFHLGNLTHLETAEHDLQTRIEEVIAPFCSARDLISTIPGFSNHNAESIIAEIGVDMSVFPTVKHLASWAGVAPTQNQSAGHTGPTPTSHGDHYLKAALGIAALSVARSNNTRLAMRYHRQARQMGKLKALVALERILLIIIYNMLNDGVAYQELGTDYYDRRPHPDQLKKNALKTLHQLGYQVELTPTQAA
ncbi:MAG TPA: IS110 family transposase [Terrimesophilobacter sp.]|nr:IS110 family transposase [Terrimesophilobacter sp.]